MTSQSYPARFFKTLDNSQIQCLLCPRGCRLKDGQRGFCFVRSNENQRLGLASYGRCTGLAVDPIEKKPLYHFYPGSLVLSFGGIGCNLSCQFCQNHNLSFSKDLTLLSQKISLEQVVQTALSHECKSVAFTYNEPIISAEFVIDVAKACQKKGIKTVAVTNGYITDSARREFFEYIDAANVDLKAFTNNFYEKLTGGTLNPILDTLLFLKKETNIWVEITNLIIPTLNDSSDEISAMTTWIGDKLGADVPIHFSAFHPAHQMTELMPTPVKAVADACHIARDNGLKHVYSGNVVDSEGSRTLCDNCGRILIERSGYKIKRMHVSNSGECESCKTICAGFF